MAPQVLAAPAPRPLQRRPRPASAPLDSTAQYQLEMDRVQQYIRQHVQMGDQAYLLSVNDARSRSCYDEIQQFLVRKLQLERARAAQHQPATAVADHMMLRNLDEYLNELDPTLFADGGASAAATAARHKAALDVPSCSSYIRRMQEDAKLGGKSWPGTPPASQPQSSSRANALKRMRSL